MIIEHYFGAHPKNGGSAYTTDDLKSVISDIFNLLTGAELEDSDIRKSATVAGSSRGWTFELNSPTTITCTHEESEDIVTIRVYSNYFRISSSGQASLYANFGLTSYNKLVIHVSLNSIGAFSRLKTSGEYAGGLYVQSKRLDSPTRVSTAFLAAGGYIGPNTSVLSFLTPPPKLEGVEYIATNALYFEYQGMIFNSVFQDTGILMSPTITVPNTTIILEDDVYVPIKLSGWSSKYGVYQNFLLRRD